jgi:hypothetical protein
MLLLGEEMMVPGEGSCWPPKIMCVLPHAYGEGSRNKACVLPPKIMEEKGNVLPAACIWRRLEKRSLVCCYFSKLY